VSKIVTTGPVVADANILIALLDPSHVHHQAVQETLDRITPSLEVDPVTQARRSVVAYVHPLNMAEVLHGYPSEVRYELLDLIEAPGTGFQLRTIPDPRQEALYLASYRAHVKMPDACVLALARHTYAPVMTLDRRLYNAAASLNLYVTEMPAAGEAG